MRKRYPMLRPSHTSHFWQREFLVQVLVFGTFILGVAESLAANPLNVEELLEVIRLERMKLRTAIVSISGTERPRVGAIDREFTADGFYSLDEGLIRFERRTKEKSLDPEKPGPRDVLNVTLVYPDRNALYSNLGGVGALDIFGPGVFRPERVSGEWGYFDPRSIGFLNFWHGAFTGSPKTFEETFKQFRQLVMSRFANLTVENGVYRLEGRSRGGFGRILVDGSQGFGIVKVDSYSGVWDEEDNFVPLSEYIRQRAAEKDEAASKALEYSDPSQDHPISVTVNWSEVNGVWIPTAFKQIDHVQDLERDEEGNRIPGSLIVVKLKNSMSLDWKQINGTIDPDTFDYHKIGLPDRTGITDWRGMSPKSVGVIHTKRPVVAVESTARKPRSKILWINLAVLAGIAAFFVYRRRVRLNRNSG